MKLSLGVFCSNRVGLSAFSPVIRREFHHSNITYSRQRSRKGHSQELEEYESKEDEVMGTLDEEALLEEFAREGPIRGEKEWKKAYSESLMNIEKNMLKTLSEELQTNMHKVRSYNKEKSTTPLDRIRFQFNKNKMVIEDFYPKDALSHSIVKYLGTNSTTEYQKKLLSLASSGLSTVAAGHQGNGKTMGLIIHALLLKRKKARGPGITSLIIVKSNEMCIRYQQIISEIYSTMPDNLKEHVKIPQIAQFLYRSTEEEESEQNYLLGEYPNSHVLVTTPHRLLDILSTRGMDFVKIRSLPFIAVDDFDSVVGSPDNLLNKGKRTLPIVQLLDYVLKLQDYNRLHNEPHPQLIFTASTDSDVSILENLRSKEWFDWNRFVQVGAFEEEGEMPVHVSIPENVGISTVLVSPLLKEGKNKLKFNLYDMETFKYGSDLGTWQEKLFRSDGNDQTYAKHRNVKRSEMTKEMRVGEFEVLVHGFTKLVKKRKLGLKNKKILVVYPDEVNDRFVQAKFSEISKNKSKIFDINTDLNFFLSEGGDEITHQDDSSARLLLIKTSALKGLCFKNLDTIVCLGIDCLKTPSHFVAIGGRFRDKSGLIVGKNGEFLSADRKQVLDAEQEEETQEEEEEEEEEEDYVDYDEVLIDDKGDQEAQGKGTRDFTDHVEGPENKIYLLQSKLDFDLVERNYLERMYIKSGLVRQFKSIGVTESDFDRDAYEAEFSTSEFEFKDY